MGAAIEKKFFLIFIFLISLVISQKYGLKIFFYFFFVTSFLSDSYSILFRIYVVLTHYKLSLDILHLFRLYSSRLDFSIPDIKLRLVFTR